MKKRTSAPAAARPSRNWRELFVARLGETSNVTAAAAAAGVSVSQVYKARRTEPAFAARWFEALAEGYDNLEMELLQHLRGGDGEDLVAAGKRKFDAATAFRCLAAHRESVAREKGRRTLADEVATIASINEKIDRLRLNAKASERAVAEARRATRSRRNEGQDALPGSAARSAGGSTDNDR